LVQAASPTRQNHHPEEEESQIFIPSFSYTTGKFNLVEFQVLGCALTFDGWVGLSVVSPSRRWQLLV